MIEVLCAKELGETAKKRISEIFVDAFDHHLSFFSKDKNKLAKALEHNVQGIHVTVGTTAEKSPYDIAAISQGVNATGAQAEMKTVREICIDQKNKIVTAPCYMMEAGIAEVKNNIDQAIHATFELI